MTQGENPEAAILQLLPDPVAGKEQQHGSSGCQDERQRSAQAATCQSDQDANHGTRHGGRRQRFTTNPFSPGRTTDLGNLDRRARRNAVTAEGAGATGTRNRQKRKEKEGCCGKERHRSKARYEQ